MADGGENASCQPLTTAMCTRHVAQAGIRRHRLTRRYEKAKRAQDDSLTRARMSV